MMCFCIAPLLTLVMFFNLFSLDLYAYDRKVESDVYSLATLLGLSV